MVDLKREFERSSIVAACVAGAIHALRKLFGRGKGPVIEGPEPPIQEEGEPRRFPEQDMVECYKAFVRTLRCKTVTHFALFFIVDHAEPKSLSEIHKAVKAFMKSDSINRDSVRLALRPSVEAGFVVEGGFYKKRNLGVVLVDDYRSLESHDCLVSGLEDQKRGFHAVVKWFGKTSTSSYILRCLQMAEGPLSAKEIEEYCVATGRKESIPSITIASALDTLVSGPFIERVDDDHFGIHRNGEIVVAAMADPCGQVPR